MPESFMARKLGDNLICARKKLKFLAKCNVK